MNSDHLVVELLSQHQDAALWVQMEELGAVWMQAPVDGVHQFTVGVGVLGADLLDVFPRWGILRDPHLKHTVGEKNKQKNKHRKQAGLKNEILNTEVLDFQFKHNLHS